MGSGAARGVYLENLPIYINMEIQCKNCGIIFEGRKGAKFHSLRCANIFFNKNRMFSKEHREKISKALKNKPLSKEHREKISKSLIGKAGHTFTEQEKLNKSLEKVEYYKKHPEKHPNNLCRGKKNYPQNKLFEELKKEYKVEQEVYYDGYWIDILLNDSIAIEVDGEYWHKNRKQNDKKRDKIISNKYKVLRINAKDVLYNLSTVIEIIGRLM